MNNRTLIGGSGTPLGEIPPTTVRMRLPAEVGNNRVTDRSLWAGSRRLPRRRHRARSTPGARQPGNQHGQPQLIVGFALEGGKEGGKEGRREGGKEGRRVIPPPRRQLARISPVTRRG